MLDGEGVPILVEPLHGEARVLVRAQFDPLRADDEPVEPRRFEELLGVLGLEDDEVLADFDLVSRPGPRRTVRGRCDSPPASRSR